jgi:hypothetical protein
MTPERVSQPIVHECHIRHDDYLNNLDGPIDTVWAAATWFGSVTVSIRRNAHVRRDVRVVTAWRVICLGLSRLIFCS